MISPRLVANALRNTATIVEQRGWSRDRMLDRDGRVCALGAMHLACGAGEILPSPIDGSQRIYSNHDPVSQELLAETARKFRCFIKSRSIPDWNDTTCTSGIELIATLHACADFIESTY